MSTHFRQDKISNQLIKYICFRYASAKCPAQIPSVLNAWSLATDHCIKKSSFTFTVLKYYLETQEIEPRYFYYIIFGLKILCAEAFPGFTVDDYEELEFIPRPHTNDWGIYQEVDNVLDPFEKNMISAGLFEMATAIRQGKNYSLGRIKGIEGGFTIDDAYVQFMKSMLVLVYQGRNQSISPVVAVATMMILKRWYHALVEITGQTYPVYLTTDVIRRAMDVLGASSSERARLASLRATLSCKVTKSNVR